MPFGPKKYSKAGFALVLALSLTSFMVLLVMALAAIVTQSSESADESNEEIIARSNALVGLKVALGELHMHARQDQRVTATGALFNNVGNGANNLVGVWNSDFNSNEYGNFIQWLVSREEPSEVTNASFATFDMPISYASEDYVSTSDDYAVLVGSGSVDQDLQRPALTQGVVAEKVLMDVEGINKFAWWVGDEGAKAKVNKVDPYASELLDQDNSAWSGLDNQWMQLSLLSTQGTNLGGIDEFSDYSLQSSEGLDIVHGFSRLNELSQANLLGLSGDAATDQAIRRNFHNFTTASYGLQTDVRFGGFKKDLSLLFELPEEAGSGQSENSYHSQILNAFEEDQIKRRNWSNANGSSTFIPDLTYEGSPLGVPGPQPELPLLFTEPIVSGDGVVYGPTLDLLRDYYRLYKGIEKENTNPTLQQGWVKGFYPNRDWFMSAQGGGLDEDDAWEQSLATWGIRGEYASEAPETRSRAEGDFGDIEVIRPTRGAYLPYLNRFTLLATAESYSSNSGIVTPDGFPTFDVNMLLQPFATIHNPYNVQIEAPAMRVLFQMDRLTIVVRRGPDPNATDSADPNLGWDITRPFRTATMDRISPGAGGHVQSGNIIKSNSLDGTANSHVFRMDEHIFYLPNPDPKAFASNNQQEFVFNIAATTYAPGEIKTFGPADVLKLVDASGNPISDRSATLAELSSYLPGNGIDLELHEAYKRETSGEWAMFVDHDGDAGTAGINEGTTPVQRLVEDIPFGSEIHIKVGGNQQTKFGLEVMNATGNFDVVGSYAMRPSVREGSSHDGQSTYFVGNNNWLETLTQLVNNSPNEEWDDQLHPVERLSGGIATNVLDVFLKPLDYEENLLYDVSDNWTATNSLRNFPNFVVSNPLAASFSRDAFAAEFEFGALGNMFHIASERFPVGQEAIGDVVGEIFEGNGGTWGYNIGDYGADTVVLLEVPTAPLQSIGQFQHANLSPSQANPALSVGHSTPSPYIDSFSKVTYVYNRSYQGEEREFVYYDQNYLVNEALWDEYFLSSIAPRPGDSSRGSLTIDNTIDPADDLRNVVNRFVSGEQPLANSRMRLAHSTVTASDRVEELLDFRTAARHLMVDGSFNINSTSVDAWIALLSSFREMSVVYHNSTGLAQDSLSGESAMPRSTLPAGTGVSSTTSSVSDPGIWSGFLELSDADIEILSESIVDEIKARSLARMQELGTSEPVPALSIASFVNRMPNASNAYNQSGTLQSTIENSGIGNAFFSGATTFSAEEHNDVGQLGLNNANFANSHFYPNPEFTIDSASMISTSLNQANILQAIGPVISARTDTFRIRSYGETVDANGNVTTAWCEALVQRVYDQDSAEELSNTELDAHARRFEILSLRWLNAEDV
ncbi:MAG: hypothetical protein ACPGN3_12770 [Opitutales bacterium]